ncbi:hypothetical protein [Lichenihabitans psoromatis]|uniref:hypothetical protein n=1 Tax=Lichenihabitans psoromatis TaxID=2528642 RepID=UPI00103844DB|nr:hypothetical protein [Lichenihabitans psoromatis]
MACYLVGFSRSGGSSNQASLAEAMRVIDGRNVGDGSWVVKIDQSRAALLAALHDCFGLDAEVQVIELPDGAWWGALSSKKPVTPRSPAWSIFGNLGGPTLATG